ncbi:MAG: hypothetical protein EPN57_13440 [Paraburkholderia sp.]|nr:MAG: hypothetical protein EPN57_13440 [Paraburkholderia sp.]
MKAKHLMVLSAFTAISHAALAHTNTTTYPLKPVLDAQLADNQVSFYFGDAAHADVVAAHGEASASIRVARKTEDETTACNEALKEALASLRADAVHRDANAVIDIETSFHGTHSASSKEFVCATSFSAAAIKVRGKLATLTAK